jgi:multiple sugar transport system ATP-binding protein
MNFISGQLAEVNGVMALRTGEVVVPLPNCPLGAGATAGRAVTLGIRPEDVVIGEDANAVDFHWTAGITLRESLGSETLLWSSFAGARIALRTSARASVKVGENVQVGFASERVSLFDQQTEVRL